MAIASVLVVIVVVGLLILLILGRLRRKPRFRLHEIGTLIDRAISAYRRNLVPLLLLSMLCLPLGSVGGLLTIRPLLFSWLSPTLPNIPFELMTTLLGLIHVLGMLGIGQTLLACGAAHLLQRESEGVRPTFGDVLPRERIGAIIGLTILLAAPSLLGSLLGIFGVLLALLWALAPAALIIEQSKPWAAMRRSIELVRPNYSLLLNTLVPLWLIGLLVSATPLIGTIWLLSLLQLGLPSTIAGITWTILLLSSVCVAPLTVLGNVMVYHTLRDAEDALHQLSPVL